MKKKVAKVIISNQEDYENRIQRIIADGVENLHVISDFDRTLTKAFVKGKSVPSVISVLRKEDYLGEDYSKKAQGLYEIYRPIEDDPHVPIEEKKEKMHEWWKKHFDLLIKSELNVSHIAQIVQSGKIEFRKYADVVLNMLHEREVPVVIFSASGLGSESIVKLLQKEGLGFDNIYTLANSLVWDDQGYLKGFNEPIIHAFNKDEGMINEFSEVLDAVDERKNIILLGDTLGDAQMADGFNFDNLIKIGFLNHDIEELLPRYEEAYDVVITGDEDMEFVAKLLEEFEIPSSEEE